MVYNNTQYEQTVQQLIRIHWKGFNYSDIYFNELIPRLKHARDEVKKKQAEVKKTEQDYKKDTSAYDSIKKNMQNLEVKILLIGHNQKQIYRTYRKIQFHEKCMQNLEIRK